MKKIKLFLIFKIYWFVKKLQAFCLYLFGFFDNILCFLDKKLPNPSEKDWNNLFNNKIKNQKS